MFMKPGVIAKLGVVLKTMLTEELKNKFKYLKYHRRTLGDMMGDVVMSVS